MTEEEWLRSQDPDPMWRHLEVADPPPPLLRKSRLLSCAFARLIWDIHDEHAKQIIESMERYADGEECFEDFSVVMGDYYDLVESEPDQWRQAAGNCVLGLWTARHDNYPLRFSITEGRLALAARQQSNDVWSSDQVPEICDVMRDVLGNPFRPVAVLPGWRTDTVLGLSRQMYETRDYSAMPVLADALQDAGCNDCKLLAHCCAAGLHVLGCWAVDLLLGKG